MKHRSKNGSRRHKSRASVSNRHSFQLLEDRRMLATFTVTSLADGVPDATDGLITLREAIIAANDETANPGADSIAFQLGLTGQIALTEGELVITDDLTITGTGVAGDLVIDAQQNSRVIEVDDTVLTLDSLTITNGRATGDGGGIFSSGTNLTLINSIVSGNTSEQYGGGIILSGGGGPPSVRLIDSTVSGNTSGDSGGGISMFTTNLTLINSTVSENFSSSRGGGIHTEDFSSLTLSNSTVSGNTGGGIYQKRSFLSLTNSTVSENSGGGIDLYYTDLSLANSTISDNGIGIRAVGKRVILTNSTVSGNSGAGIDLRIGSYGGDSSGLTLTNSTVSGNSGAGIYSRSNYFGRGFAGITLTNSTISGNTTSINPNPNSQPDSYYGPAGGVGGGIRIGNGWSLRVRNSIIAGNSDNGPAPDFNDPGSTGNLTVEHSIIGDTTGTGLTTGNNNQLNVDFTTVLETEDVGGVTVPRLTDNGGPVETIALLPDSPAINAGENALVGSRLTDQRGDGFDRIVSGTVDIGAFESEFAPSTFLLGDVNQNRVVDLFDIAPFIDVITAQEFQAEADINQDGEVTLFDIAPFIELLTSTPTPTPTPTPDSNPVTFTVNTLTDGAPDATDGLTTLREAIIAANDAVNPEADFIVFEPGLTGEIFLDASQGELVITDDLTITGTGAAENLVIDAQQNSRVIRVTDAVTNLTLDSLTITNGRTTAPMENGGGILFDKLNSSGTLALTNSTVSGNIIEGDFASGGGISTYRVTVTLTNSTVSRNSSTDDGGGIHVRGGGAGVRLTSSAISGNSSADNGGGIFAADSNVTLINSTLSGNTSGSRGGGISTFSGVVRLTSSAISGNSSADDGGGIFAADFNVTLTNSTLSGNTSGDYGGGIYTINGAVTLTNSTVSENTSTNDGGGIHARRGPVRLTGSTLSGNTSVGGSGGGIATDDDGYVTLANSTVSGNTSEQNGGGIVTDDGYVTLTNSTLSGNTSGSRGGGIRSQNGAVTLTNSTLSGNTAVNVGGGIDSESLGIHNSIIAGNTDNGTAPNFIAPRAIENLTVEHSIIGNRTGTRVTLGNNNQLNVDFTNVLETEVVNGVTVPLLTDNGGPVETIALLPGSPAIDAGDNALAVDAAGNALLTDQRGAGFDRILFGSVDIGAFESPFESSEFLLGDVDQNGVVNLFDIAPFIDVITAQGFQGEADINQDGEVNLFDIAPFIELLTSTPTPDSNPVTFTVNSLTDGAPDATDGLTTLREAIIAANDEANPEADFIVFEAGLTGEILLDATQGELLITDGLTITGPGAAGDLVVDAQQNSRVIRATDAVTNLTLDSLTITNGKTTGLREGGGGILFEGLNSSTTLTLTNSLVSGNTIEGNYASGGGINVSNVDLTLTNSTVSGNTSLRNGGGISASYSYVTLTDSTISENISEPNTLNRNNSYGGGIFSFYSDLTLSNSMVIGNTSAKGGGIRALGSAVTLTNSTISGNTGARGGGGIYIGRRFRSGIGELTLSSTTVSGNTSGELGGGVFSTNGPATLTDSTISGNMSRSHGGGIYTAYGSVTLTNSTVSGNTTTGIGDGGGIFSGGDLTLTNSTVAGNTAIARGGGVYRGGRLGETLAFINSLIAGNTDRGQNPDINGFSVVENSIIGDTKGTQLEADNNNQLNIDFTTVLETEVVDGVTIPLLTHNGGTVETIALLPGSPAIDAGDNALAVDADGNALLTDQRGAGFDRILSGTVDIGSFEFEPPEILIGDVDQNGVVDLFDIAPFIELLTSPATSNAIAQSNAVSSANLLDTDPESLEDIQDSERDEVFEELLI